MSNFPIPRTTRTPSGRGVGVAMPMQVDRSGEIIGNALMELGNVGFDEAVKWNRLHAIEEHSAAQKKAQERLVLLAEETDDEIDPTLYRTMYDSAKKDIRAYRPQSKLGGRYYDFWVDASEPRWDMATATTIKNRLATIQQEDIAQRRGDYAGKLEGHLTDIIMNEGVEAGYARARDPGLIKNAAEQGLTAAHLLGIARTARSMAVAMKADQEQAEVVAAARQEDQRKALGQQVRARALMTADGQDNLTRTEIAQLEYAGKISSPDADVAVSRLTRQKEPSYEDQKRADAVMHWSRGLLEQGEITEDRYAKILRDADKWMTVAQARRWMEYGTLDDERKNLNAEIRKAAETEFERLFPETNFAGLPVSAKEIGNALKQGKDLPSLGQYGMVAKVFDGLNAYLDARTGQGKPFDPAGYRDEATRLIRLFWQEEFDRQNPPQPVLAPVEKKQGWVDRQWNGPRP